MAIWMKAAGALALLALTMPAAYADELDAIFMAGRIRAGVCLSSGPAGSRDSSGGMRGYDVDVATLLAKQLGVTLQIIETNVASRVEMLLKNQVDIVLCTMTATPERARQIDFSLPYLRTGIKLLVPKNSPITKLGDVGATTRLVVQRSTTGEAMARAQAPTAQISYAENVGDVLLQVREGKVDAALDDGLLTDWAAATYPDELVSLPQAYSTDSLAIGVRKGNPELLRWLDLFASRFVSSGTYAAEYRKWWGAEPPPINAVW